MITNCLCCRCEHRATFIEDTKSDNPFVRKPRYQCGDINAQVISCYMYKPTKPLAMEPDEGDDRPLFSGAMISARMHPSEEQPEFTARIKKVDNKYIIYWTPKEEEGAK